MWRPLLRIVGLHTAADFESLVGKTPLVKLRGPSEAAGANKRSKDPRAIREWL